MSGGRPKGVLSSLSEILDEWDDGSLSKAQKYSTRMSDSDSDKRYRRDVRLLTERLLCAVSGDDATALLDDYVPHRCKQRAAPPRPSMKLNFQAGFQPPPADGWYGSIF